MVMRLLKYNPLSLTDIAARKVSVILFTEPTILSPIINLCKISPPCIPSPEIWHDTLEVKIPDEISKLQLPDLLKKLLEDIVEQMGSQVRHWKIFHEEYLCDSHGEEFYFDVSVLEKLYWTAAGAVDYRKTAEKLIHSNAIDAVKKFKLACLYCLKDCVLKCWRELSEDSKSYFCRAAESCLESGWLAKEFWWLYIIEGEESELYNLIESYRGGEDAFHQNAFRCSVEEGNKTAAGYFFQKLINEEKENILRDAVILLTGLYSNRNNQNNSNNDQALRNKTFPLEKYSELLIYLLSLMTPEQEMEIFEERPIDVLVWFLAWPSHDMLLANAVSIWAFLSDNDRENLLCLWYENFEYVDNHTVKLYHDFFLRIPTDSSKAFVNRQCNPRSYFHDILLNQNIKALEIFLRCLDAAARKKIVLSELALNYFEMFLLEGQLDVVEVCFREASLSKDDRDRLKKKWDINETKVKTRKWAKIFNHQDETNKRARVIRKRTHQQTRET